MGCLKVGILVLGVCFTLVACFFLLLAWAGRRYNHPVVQELRGMLPQVRQDFAYSRQKLDLLADGAFAGRQATVSSFSTPNPDDTNCLGHLMISFHAPTYERLFNRRGVSFSEWYTIDWLTDNEKDAIIFLFSSQQIVHHFTVVMANITGHTIEASIYFPGTHVSIFISRGLSNRPPDRQFHHEPLGSGYYLYIYDGTPGFSIAPVFTIFGCIFLVPAIIMIAIYVRLSIKRKKQNLPL
ncbi:MAG: hypothetical protein FWC32_09835 [Firmicutes bacterium]|nr:hypothetical protein [Bacillota bacterium]